MKWESCPRTFFFFSSRRRHTSSLCDWSSDVCSSDLGEMRIASRREDVPTVMIEHPSRDRDDRHLLPRLLLAQGSRERKAVLASRKGEVEEDRIHSLDVSFENLAGFFRRLRYQDGVVIAGQDRLEE